MPYSYDDFVSAANKAGLMKEFSAADLKTAQRYPEFGMSILGFKQDIHKATTPEAKLLAHQSAEELRKSYGNYTGEQWGSQYKSAGKIPGQIDTVLDQIVGYQPAENPYSSQYKAALDKIGSFGEFSYGEAPTYSNQYQEQQKALLDSIINREDFSWSKDQDPLWPVYKKEYLREGERATADALGKASAASGGRPSTAAVAAATQAGDYYAAKLNDVIPTLYQQAYDKYLNEYQMKLSDLGAVNGQEQMDYQKYLDQLGQYNTDRGFSYQKYLDDFTRQLQGLDALESAQRLHSGQQADVFSILQGKLGSLQSQDSVDYGRYLDQITRQDQREQAARQLQQGQVDAILAAGGMPTEDMVAGSGYDQTYIQALRDAYLREQGTLAARKVSKSSGRPSGGGAQDYDGLFAAAKQSGHAKSYIANNYKKFGFTSSSGLYDDFKGWDEGQGETEQPGGGKDWRPVDAMWNRGSGGKDRSSLDYRPDEGIFTWNGKRYSSLKELENALNKANLSAGEEETLKRKLDMFGFFS